jgi:hypothetical protein
VIREFLAAIDSDWVRSAEVKANISVWIAKLGSPDRLVRRTAIALLDECDPHWKNSDAARNAVPTFLAALESPTCVPDIWALGIIGDRRAVTSLERLAAAPAAEVRAAAVRALAGIPDPRSTEALLKALRDADEFVSELAAVGLGEFAAARAIQPLVAAASKQPAGSKEIKKEVRRRRTALGGGDNYGLIQARSATRRDIYVTALEKIGTPEALEAAASLRAACDQSSGTVSGRPWSLACLDEQYGAEVFLETIAIGPSRITTDDLWAILNLGCAGHYHCSYTKDRGDGFDETHSYSVTVDFAEMKMLAGRELIRRGFRP